MVLARRIIARQNGKALLTLGFLWARRDYTQAESWFRQALVLAQSLNDPALYAHSLNRIGNWHLNAEHPHEALSAHREALTIFEHLQDSPGIAETLDLLGMTSYLGGDLIGVLHTTSRQSCSFVGWGTSLATLALRGPTSQTDTLVSVASLTEGIQDAELALRIAREIGQRSAEAYVLFQLGLCLGSQGEYGRAIATARQSLDISEEIEHRQWQTAAHTVLGGIDSGLLAYPQALEHFKQALALAQEIGSIFWTHITMGYLASTAILLHDLPQAETILHATPSSDRPAQTMAQHMVWGASVELALARGKPTHALEMLDQLIPSTTQGAEGQSSLRVLKLRGEALVALQQPAEAEMAFTSAYEIARTQGVRPRHLHLCISLGNLYHAEARQKELLDMVEVLGIGSVDFLDCPDGDLDQADSCLDRREDRRPSPTYQARCCYHLWTLWWIWTPGSHCYFPVDYDGDCGGR